MQDSAIRTEDSLSTVILKKKKKATKTHTHKNPKTKPPKQPIKQKNTQPLLNSDNSVTGSVCKNAHSTHNIYTPKFTV